MKKFKLLKDTPTVKAGTIFVEEGDNFNDYKELVQVVPYGCPNRPFFVVKEIINFDDWFEEIPEKYERWRGGIGDVYYFLNVDVRHEIDTHDDIDDYRYISGNYFKTEEDAEAYKEYLIARQVLLDDAHGGRFSYGEDNWCPCYSETSHNWVSISGNTYYPGTIYFKTREALEESLKNHKDQWEIVRKYEMGEIE